MKILGTFRDIQNSIVTYIYTLKTTISGVSHMPDIRTLDCTFGRCKEIERIQTE